MTKKLMLSAVTRSFLCLVTILALALCSMPSTTALLHTETAYAADQDEDDSDVDNPTDDDDEEEDEPGGYSFNNAARQRNTRCTTSPAVIKKAADGAYYTEGRFSIYIAENYKGGTSAYAKADSSCSEKGRKLPFACASYTKATFGMAIEELAELKKNADGRTVAVNKNGSKLIGSKAFDFDTKKDKTVLVWIESVKTYGDNKKATIDFAGDTEETRIYTKSHNGKMMDCIKVRCRLDSNTANADKENKIIANKIPLIYKNKGEHQVLLGATRDSGSEAKVNDGDKTAHRFSLYTDAGGVESYTSYTAYKFSHAGEGKSNATENKSATFNVTVNLASCGLKSIVCWNTAASDYKNRKPHHYDRNVNQWILIKLSASKEYVQIDLDGGALDVSKKTSLFTNGYTSNGKKVSGQGKSIASGSSITVGTPIKNGYSFAGWQWTRVTKSPKGYKEIGQNRSSYSDSKYPAPPKTNIDTDNKSRKYCAKDLSTISGDAVYPADSPATPKQNAKTYSGSTATTINVHNGWQTMAVSDDNRKWHNKGWEKFPAITNACVVYKARWVSNLYSVHYLVDGVEKRVDDGLKVNEDYNLVSPSTLGASSGWFLDKGYSKKASSYRGNFPSHDVYLYGFTEKTEANTINYYVDGELVSRFHVDWNNTSKLHTTYSSSLNGPLYGRISVSADQLVEYVDNSASWTVDSALLTSSYRQHYETTSSCVHTTSCSHWTNSGYTRYWKEYDKDGNLQTKSEWVDTSHYDHSYDYVHDGWSCPGLDSNYSASTTLSNSISFGNISNPHGGSWHKWFEDPSFQKKSKAQYTEGDIRNGLSFYSYTTFPVTYVINQGPSQKTYSHDEYYGSTELPSSVSEENPEGECGSARIRNDFGGTLVGWFTDKDCSSPVSQKGYLIKEDAVRTYYAYTSHSINWIVNGKTLTSETYRYGEGINPHEKDKRAFEEYPESELVAWFIRSESGQKAGTSEKAEEGLSFHGYTRYDINFIMDSDVSLPATTKIYTYRQLGGTGDHGSGKVKFGETVTLPTGSGVSKIVTDKGCEDWATHPEQNELRANTWFDTPDCSSAITTVTVTGPTSVYSYNVAYVTIDLTKYAKSIDKAEGGKWQLYRHKVTADNINNGSKTRIRDYIDELVDTSGVKSFPTASGNRRLFKYGANYDIDDLPNIYWLNTDSQKLSRSAKAIAGGYIDIKAPSKTDRPVGSVCVTKTLTVYKDYAQGLVDGVIGE